MLYQYILFEYAVNSWVLFVRDIMGHSVFKDRCAITLAHSHMYKYSQGVCRLRMQT